MIGVWLGNDDHSPTNGVTGGGLPAEIWRDFATHALQARLIQPIAPPHRPAQSSNNLGAELHRLFHPFLKWLDGL